MAGARRVLVLGMLAGLTLAAPAQAGFIPGKQIDSAAAVTYGGISIASDGTGAVTYLKTVGAQPQVWVATLNNGSWSAGQRVDVGLAGTEVDPKVAAAPGGRVVVTWLGSGQKRLHSAIQTSTGAGFGSPAEVRFAGVNFIQQDATIAMGPTGVAYAIWCEGPTGQGHALAARLAGATWSVLSSPIDTGAHTACNGGNTPDVGIGVDASGNAIAMWNEQDTMSHPYARRLIGTTQGLPMDLRVPTLFGHTNQDFGDMVQVAVAADGSAWTVHRSLYDYGGTNRARSVARYIPAGSNTPSGPSLFDGWPANAPDGAEHPFVAVNASGNGLWASNASMSVDEWAGSVSGSTVGPAIRTDAPGADVNIVDSPQTAVGDGGLGAVGWVNTKVFARAWNGSGFGGPVQISTDSLGNNLTWLSEVHHTSADGTGDVVFGFKQDDGTNQRVVVAALAQPPTAPVGTTSSPQKTARPLLTWTSSRELYGGLAQYRVLVDGKQIGTTGASTASFKPTKDIAQGNHTYQVVAVDVYGQSTSSAGKPLSIQTLTSNQLKKLIPSKLKAVKGKVVVAKVKCTPVCGTVTVSGAYHIKIRVKNKKGKKVTKTISIGIGSKTFKVLAGKKATQLFFFLNKKGKNKLGHGKLTVFITLSVKELKVSATKQATLKWAKK